MRKVFVSLLVLFFCLFLVNRLYGGYNQTLVLTLDDPSKTDASTIESKKTTPKKVLEPAKINPCFVVIDPGHGTKGSRGGANGEAVYNLDIAKRVFNYLDADNRFTPVLTHSSIGENLGAKNAEEDNRIRAQIANRVNARLYLRLHCDAPGGASSIYYPRLHPDTTLARESGRIAFQFSRPLRTLVSGLRFGGVKGDESTAIGSRNGGLLTGSRSSRVPVVLIEMVPLNVAGKRWIGDGVNQDKLARSIASTIEQSVR